MKVLFIQPACFLRTSKRTNPYFDSIIRVCENSGIEWDLLLPKKERLSCGYPVGRIGDIDLLTFCSVWFWRFCRVVFPWMSTHSIYYHFGRLARPFFKRISHADLVVTITGVFADVLAGMIPNKRVVDVQHGVISATHRGYFDENGLLLRHYRNYSMREFWVYGRGYVNCFFKNANNAQWLKDRVRIIGDVLEHKEVQQDERKDIIAFSAQFTADFDAEIFALMLRRMKDFLGRVYAKYGNGYTCVLKQHPRYNGVCDISTLKEDFPELVVSSEPWEKLYPRMALHVTFSSTVAFDAASNGVPTYFVPYPENKILDGRYYSEDFGYPYGDKTFEELLAMQKECGKFVHDRMRNWYTTFYTAFGEKKCRELLLMEVPK